MTNTVPEELKKDLVTPLHKKGNRLEVSNYRLVSILCIVSKGIFDNKDILYTFHSGFRNSSSTDSYLIYLTDYLRS